MTDMKWGARRHARAVIRLEKKIASKKAKLETWRERKERHEISPHKFADKKAALDNDLRELNARLNIRKGAVRQANHG